MTISSVVRKAGPFAGNSAATTFPFAFKVFDKTDVKALLVNSTGTSTTLTLDSDYSVVLNANQDTSPGGSILYPITGVPLPAGYSLVLLGDLPYDQETNITNSGGFYPSVIEDMSDRSTIQIQQLAEITSRAIVYNESESTSPVLPTAAARANGVMGFDALGQLEVFPLPASVGAGDLKNESWTDGTDYVSGTSTSVTLSRAYATKANLGSLVMQGIAQDPATYSLNGLILTFLDDSGNATPIPAGLKRIWCIGGTTLSISVTPDNSVTDAKVAPGSKLLNRITNWIDVNDFPGVDKTGASDSTAGMQAAHNTGKLVRYPAGAYKFSTITIPAGGIIGDGTGQTLLYSTDTTGADLITYTGTGGSTQVPLFRDFLIEALGTKGSGAGIHFLPSSAEILYICIDNIITFNIPYGVYYSAASNYTISNSKFVNYTIAGVYIQNTNEVDSGDSSIVNCLFNTGQSSGNRYGIWYRSSGGLKVTNSKFNGGGSGFVLGLVDAMHSTGDLAINSCSFENMTNYGMFFGRDSGSFSFGAITLSNIQIAICPTGIQTDPSGFMSQFNLANYNIALTGAAGNAIGLNGVSNFSIGNGTIVSNGAAPFGLVITSSCANGKVILPSFAGFSGANAFSNASLSTYVSYPSQSGTASLTASTTYAALFSGSVAVTFPAAFLTPPNVRCAPSATAGGQIACFAQNVTVNGFTMVGISATSGGAMANNTWVAEGVI